MKTLLEVQDISKYFGKKNAITNINFNLKYGVILGMIGNNGAGKTTTLKCILNLLDLDKGKVLINGKTIFEDNLSFKKAISYIPDKPLYYYNLTVYEHMKFVAMAFDIDKTKFENTVKLLCNKYEIEEYLNMKFTELSKGTQQKVSIVLALLKPSKLLILDEPFDGLDVMAIDKLINSIKNFKNNKCSVIICTHNLELINELIDEVLILKNGKQVIFEDINTLKSRLKTNNLKNIFKMLMTKRVYQK